MSYSVAAIDLRTAPPIGSANALWLGTNHTIAMDTAGSGGAPNLRLSSNGTALTIAGGQVTLTGALTLAADPAAALQPVTLQYFNANLAPYAPLASPTFTGTPSLPTGTTGITQTAGNNTTALATTAFVQTALPVASSTTPGMDGAAAVGTGTTYARADHVHPTDTTRAPLASPTFTGTVTIPSGASIAGYLPLSGGTLSSSLFFTPGGIPSFQLNAADSTATGGNARGGNAIDLQLSRTAATNVASGVASGVLSGINNTASGTQSVVVGGVGSTSGGNNSIVLGGSGNFSTGTYSVAAGNGAACDLYGQIAFGSGLISGGRRSQWGVQVLRATSAANTTPVRLTADAAAAGATNTVNVTYSDSAFAISVQLIALDATPGNNFYAWSQPLGLLRRNGTAATLVYVPGTAATRSNDTTTGIVITDSAETTNGGYSITFTPPTGNTAIWRVVATVLFTRLDGA